jgi:hypothetical protein
MKIWKKRFHWWFFSTLVFHSIYVTSRTRIDLLESIIKFENKCSNWNDYSLSFSLKTNSIIQLKLKLFCIQILLHHKCLIWIMLLVLISPSSPLWIMCRKIYMVLRCEFRIVPRDVSTKDEFFNGFAEFVSLRE